MLSVMMEGNPDNFPLTLRGFGYGFNENGQLRKLDPNTYKPGNEPFEFSVRPGDYAYNQRHYEALGEVITEYIYNLLEQELKLDLLYVPEDELPQKRSFIFASKDALTNPDRLLLLIHGSGVVRAGQWSRSLIINDCLAAGTQIPFIRRAMEIGYAVLVLNTNDHFRTINGNRFYIRNSRSADEHMEYVWKRYVSRADARHVAIIAHSFGGQTAVNLAKTQFPDFKERVFAIAMTHSVHRFSKKIPKDIIRFLQRISVNWVAADELVDSPIQTPENEIQQVSAGHTIHEYTSWSSFESIFTFLHKRYMSATEKGDL